MLTRALRQRVVRQPPLRLPEATPPHFEYRCESCKRRFLTTERAAYPQGNNGYDCSECAQTQGLYEGKALWL